MEKLHAPSNLIMWVKKLEALGISSSPHWPFTCIVSGPQHFIAVRPWASMSSFHSKVLQPTILPVSCGPASFLLDSPWGLGPCIWGSVPPEAWCFRSWDWGNGAAWCPWATLAGQLGSSQSWSGSGEPMGQRMLWLGSFTATTALLGTPWLLFHGDTEQQEKLECVILGKSFNLSEPLQHFSED